MESLVAARLKAALTEVGLIRDPSAPRSAAMGSNGGPTLVYFMFYLTKDLGLNIVHNLD